jgi:hypothetical protein
MYKDYNEFTLGPKPRARHKEINKMMNECFENPIIHREIQGDKIYVPLNLSRIWSKID